MKRQFILSLLVLFVFITATLVGYSKIIEVPDVDARMNLMILGGEAPAAGGESCSGSPFYSFLGDDVSTTSADIKDSEDRRFRLFSLRTSILRPSRFLLPLETSHSFPETLPSADKERSPAK